MVTSETNRICGDIKELNGTDQPQPDEAAVFLTLDELAFIAVSLDYDKDMHDENSSTYRSIGVITEKMKAAYAKLKEKSDG